MDINLQNNYSEFQFNTGCDHIAGLYNIGNTIGRGHFAVVKEAKHVFTEEKVAVKIIDKTKLDSQAREHLFSEVMCMKLVQHPNVVRLYEVIDTTNKLYLVLELGDGGDLYDYIMKFENGLPEIEARKYFRQIVHAISYCHNLHVVHRDLKPENVVFFEKLELVKLTDFGFSNKFIPGQTLNTSCGSLAYSAPEILLGDDYDAPKIDIWSLGVLLYMLVCGKLPFNEPNDSETLSRIMDCKYDFPNGISPSCRALIRKMLVKDASNRASLDEIVKDKWLEQSARENRAVEDACLPLISRDRLTMEEQLEILNKMSEGGLASVDEIQRVLDINEYSYISATFFLLAERKLKRRYLEEYLKLKFIEMEAETTDSFEEEEGGRTSSSVSSAQEAGEERFRRFSMILEDEEDEEEVEELNAVYSLATVREELEIDSAMCKDKIVAPNPSRSCSRMSDADADNRADSEHSSSIINFSNFRHQFTSKHRCKSAIFSNNPRLHCSRSLSSIPHSISVVEENYNNNAAIKGNFLKALATGKNKTSTNKFQRNLSATFSRRTSSILSAAESSLDDNFQYISRPRPSLPAQQLSAQLVASKRRSFPALSHLYSTCFSQSQSISDVSDNESRKLSFNKFSRHFQPQQQQQSRFNSTSNSSIASENLRTFSTQSSNRRMRMKSSGSRPNSLGATMNMPFEELQLLIANAAAKAQTGEDRQKVVATAAASVVNTNSPTVTGIAMHRDICAPIHEEEELIRSRSYIDRDTAFDDSPSIGFLDKGSATVRCDSVECTPSKWRPTASSKQQVNSPLQSAHKLNRQCLSSQQLTQSSLSLSSLASSLRDSRVMMNVIRGAIELQAGSSQNRARPAGPIKPSRLSAPAWSAASAANQPQRSAVRCRSQVSTSASVSQRESQNCDFLAASLTSLPEQDAQKLSLLSYKLDHQQHHQQYQHHQQSASWKPTQPQQSGTANSAPPGSATSRNRHSFFLRASNTINRKARFIVSCCKTS